MPPDQHARKSLALLGTGGGERYPAWSIWRRRALQVDIPGWCFWFSLYVAYRKRTKLHHVLSLCTSFVVEHFSQISATMKINPTSQIISLAQQTLSQNVLPALEDSEARSAVELIQAVLSDLLKRQGPTLNLLKKVIAEGEALERDMIQIADVQIAKPTTTEAVPLNGCFDALAKYHESLTRRLEGLCKLLAGTEEDKPQAASLLRQAAKWEVSYYVGLQAEQGRPFGDDPAAPATRQGIEMSRKYLQTFFNNKHGPVEVTTFARLDGGHGKQTYSCTVKHPNGMEEDLIIRKADAAPITLLHKFLIEQEFKLLTSLSRTDFPAPHPIDLGLKSEEIDGSFFTMSRIRGKVSGMFLKNPDQRFSEHLLLQCAELLAKLHSYPLETFSDYFEQVEGAFPEGETIQKRYQRSLQMWREYLKDSDHLPSTYMAWILDWLERHIPNDSRRPVLCHGDFNLHNILVENDNIIGVLDWEVSDFGAPELDLAYIRPLVSKNMDWQCFVDHYHASGGPKIVDSNFQFCQAYSVLPAMFAFNKATLNLQQGKNRDIRFAMVEYGYQAVFMEMGLALTAPVPDVKQEDTSKSLPEFPHSEDKEEPKANGQNGTLNASSEPNSQQERVIQCHGGKKLTVYGDWTHVRQTPGPQPHWQDSVVLTWWDEENEIGGFHRLGHEPNVPGGGRVALWTNLLSPDGMFKRVQDKPLRETDLLSNGGWGSGDDTCQVAFIDGEHIWTINDDDASARLAFKDCGPNIDGFPKGSTLSKEFSTAHFDIPGTVTGWMKLKGKEYKVNGLGIRDHGWGPRDWSQSIISHRWAVGTCGPLLSFFAISYHAASTDKIATFGWVVRGETVTYASAVDILTYMEIDSCVNRGGHVKFTLTTGEVLDVEITAVPGHKASVCYHHDIPCVDRHCTFECNGLHGFCNFESSSNVQHGKKKPGTLIDGVIGDGFTPN